MRIVFLADPGSNNGRYRALLPMQALGERTRHEVVQLLPDDVWDREISLRGVDVLYIHRYCEAPVQRLVKAAQAAGAAVLWDNDDDMGSMPRSSVTYRHFGGIAWQRRLADMRKVFAHTDLATSPSEVLSERFAEWGASATGTVENFLADEAGRVDRRPHEGTTIGWIAGLEHLMDVQKLPIIDVLRRILDERPDCRVVTVGVGLDVRHERYTHIEQVRLRDLPQTAASFDLAIAPIADTAFNRSRSNIKLKEYAAAGTPWLASPIGPYAGMGEKQGGRLVPDDGWYEAILRLLDKPRERRKLAKRAARWAQGETVSKNVDAWERTCERAVELRRERAALRAPRSAA